MRAVDWPPLGAADQELVIEAWELAAPTIARAERLGPDLDYAGAVAERLCRHARRYDPSVASLAAWAQMEADYAIADARRMDMPKGCRRRGPAGIAAARKVSLESSAGPDAGGRPLTVVETLGSADRVPAWEQQEAAAGILRGLRPAERAMLWGVVVEGRTAVAVAAELGVSTRRASQLYTGALAWLRRIQRRGVPC